LCSQQQPTDAVSTGAADVVPSVDTKEADNYDKISGVLNRLVELCVKEAGGAEKPRPQEQRLLRNMCAHIAVLELLQIPYDKVIFLFPFTCSACLFCLLKLLRLNVNC